jgi:hypothetical protein
MRKSILTTGLVALSIPLLGGVALAAAHSVSSTPLTCPFWSAVVHSNPPRETPGG